MSLRRRSFLQAGVAALGLRRLTFASTGVIRQPYLQRLLEDKVSILWTSSQLTSGSVAVLGADGSSTMYPAAITPFQPAATRLTATYYQYQVDVTGLDPGLSYKYRVFADGQLVAADPELNRFRTAGPGDFSFLVLGDSGELSDAQAAIIRQMSKETDVAKVIHVGDLAYESGTFAQLDSAYFAFNNRLMSSLPFYATPGNHEYLTNAAAPFLAGHLAPTCGVPAADAGRYYSYDWGDAHFTSVDSNLLPDGDAAARMLTWLEADLTATRKYWKIVFLHHPPYPTGSHAADPISALVRDNVVPVLERHGVQLVLSGHEHGYEHTFPLRNGQRADASQPATTYVISGGGGAPLHTVGSLPQCACAFPAYNYLRVEVTGTTLTFVAKGEDGNAVDRVTLAPPPALSGAVNSGDFSTSVAPGSLVSLFGQNLSIRPTSCTSLPLPRDLGGVSVTANGIPAPILYASPGQINVQLPFEVSGPVTLQVNTPNGFARSNVTVATTAPSILAVVNDNRRNSTSNPVAQGSWVTLYATGLGTPLGTVATGQAAPGIAVPVAAPVQVMIGDTTIAARYAGLAPGFAGLNQINFMVPPELAGGTYSLRISAGAAISKSTPIIVAAVAVNLPR